MSGRVVRVGLAGTLAACLAVAAAACGGGSSSAQVAQVSTQETSTVSSSNPISASPAAFSACIRAHGVPDFPDPDSQGHLQIQIKPGSDISPGSPKLQDAMRACRRLAPGGAVTPTQQAKELRAMLKYSACMRAQGLPSFPDPQRDPSGAIRLMVDPHSDIRPDSPQFQRAQKACQSLMPGGLSGS